MRMGNGQRFQMDWSRKVNDIVDELVQYELNSKGRECYRPQATIW